MLPVSLLTDGLCAREAASSMIRGCRQAGAQVPWEACTAVQIEESECRVVLRGKAGAEGR